MVPVFRNNSGTRTLEVGDEPSVQAQELEELTREAPATAGLHPEADLALAQSLDDLTITRDIDLTDRVDAAALREVLQPSSWRARYRDVVFVLDETLPEAVRCEPEFQLLTPRALPALVEVLEERKNTRNPVTIAVPEGVGRGLTDLLERVEELGALVLPLSTVVEQRCAHLPLEGEKVVELRPPSLVRSLMASAFDLVVGLCGCLLVLLILGPVMAAIWLEDRGPIFYLQDRIGRNGKVFRLIKFRSMRPDAEKSGPQWARSNDERLTRVGAVLRRYHVDELPQFINVLLGHMSVVGPRPERPMFVQVLTEHLPYYDRRHMVRPGLTGWGTVKVGYSNSIPAKRLALQYDLYHLANSSFTFDMRIVARTALHLVRRPEVRNRLMI